MSKKRRQPHRAPQRRPANPGAARAPRPGSSRRPGPAPVAQLGWRAGLERASYPILVRLTRLPKWFLGLITAGVLLGGLLAPAPWSPVLLALIILFLTWLLVLAWPKLEPAARIIRAAVIAVVAALLIAQATGVF
ncbi:DUF6703 family protein [Phytoactinopolyspora halotolerans]|uniref:Uncharacterized protein n=1 Tax=Phytoactinopolyspora halotolerans TaxID=1981512 RepID=A0A6L9S4M7_9ACTN|nr:DUF6703 family protein [Phytoactinopolyspora halotolerans]NED99956.1 hypothetical protein [Phytoactinopolyspora halotolerans]